METKKPAAESWQPEVDELALRRSLAEKMGGAENVRRQHENGKLTARERIDLLADPGSFREFMSLMGSGVYQDNQLVDFIPKGRVAGMATIEGRKVVVSAGDFTVRGGSGTASGHGTMGLELGATERAMEWRLPAIYLLDGAGGSVRGFEEMGRTYPPDGNLMSSNNVKLLRMVPMVSAVMGSVAGLGAADVCLAHFSVMVKGTSQVFPGGPPVVKAAWGRDVTKEELGGWRIHACESGVVNNVGETEEEALGIVRRFLSYLPSNVWELPPRGETTDPVTRRDEALLTLMPKSKRRPYSIQTLMDGIFDAGSFFEIAPLHGRSRITGLARLNGYPVGVLGNNPLHLGGATDVKGGSKVQRFIQICDTFHLPIISIADEPGVMVGVDSERAGIERAGAQLITTVCDSQMPWATVVIGQCFGVGGQCQHRNSGMFRRFVWPSATWGSMHIEGGTSAAYRREIESASNPEAKKAQIEARLKAMSSPFRTAEATGQDIIDPRNTRAMLCEFIEDAQRVIRLQLGPTGMPYRP